MLNCVDFVEKHSLIFFQVDYSLTKLLYNAFLDLAPTKQDSIHAVQIARGFGVRHADIKVITDMNSTVMNKHFNDLKSKTKKLGV